MNGEKSVNWDFDIDRISKNNRHVYFLFFEFNIY